MTEEKPYIISSDREFLEYILIILFEIMPNIPLNESGIFEDLSKSVYDKLWEIDRIRDYLYDKDDRKMMIKNLTNKIRNSCEILKGEK